MNRKKIDFITCIKIFERRRFKMAGFLLPIQLFSKKVVTFNIDFASYDGNRTHQNAFRSCSGNFLRKTIETEQIKYDDNQIEHTLLRSKTGFIPKL